MGKKRIFEIAKEYGVKSPEIIELLAKHNITKTNFSSVEESDVAIIHAAFSKKAVKQEQPQAVHKTEKPQASGSAEKQNLQPLRLRQNQGRKKRSGLL